MRQPISGQLLNLSKTNAFHLNSKIRLAHQQLRPAQIIGKKEEFLFDGSDLFDYLL